MIACACKCNKACKIDKYLDTKNCSCETHLSGKLVIPCEDEILNTTQTSLDDEKVTCKENNSLTHKISWKIKCLLLLTAFSIACYYYDTKDLIKKNK